MLNKSQRANVPLTEFNDSCSLLVPIRNRMVSSAIWTEHARVSFSNTIKIAQVQRTSAGYIQGVPKNENY